MGNEKHTNNISADRAGKEVIVEHADKGRTDGFEDGKTATDEGDEDAPLVGSYYFSAGGKKDCKNIKWGRCAANKTSDGDDVCVAGKQKSKQGGADTKSDEEGKG